MYTHDHYFQDDLTPDFDIAVSSCRDDRGRIVRNVHAEDRELVAIGNKLEKTKKKKSSIIVTKSLWFYIFILYKNTLWP